MTTSAFRTGNPSSVTPARTGGPTRTSGRYPGPTGAKASTAGTGPSPCPITTARVGDGS